MGRIPYQGEPDSENSNESSLIIIDLAALSGEQPYLNRGLE
jgi:hypothetical protein